jgi:hypothetical protein
VPITLYANGMPKLWGQGNGRRRKEQPHGDLFRNPEKR